MRKFTRTATPAILLKPVGQSQQLYWEMIGDRYANNRSANSAHVFQWPTIGGVSLNQHLLPDLRALTESHCAYCDQFPMRAAEESIDHFLPKSDPAFYSQVCRWENLYLSCKSCQAKGDAYDSNLLRPDDAIYTFDRYFIYNYLRHEIEVNPSATPDEQQRAEVTIRLFTLNEPGHKTARRHVLERWEKRDAHAQIDDFNYRFMLL